MSAVRNVPDLISSSEHTPLYPQPEDGLASWLASVRADISTYPERFLGLHMDDHLWRVGAYVGMVWLGGDEERWVLRVHPKQVFKDMDYLSMYLRA